MEGSTMISSFFSYLLIPAFTLFLARDASLFSTNFSSFCGQPGRRLEFLLWCLVTGGYFCFSLRTLMRTFYNSRFSVLPAAGTLFYLISALLPYRPTSAPLLSLLHVVGSFCASVLLLLCLYLLAFRLCRKSPRRGMRCLLELAAASLFCIIAWSLTGIINTAMEICLIITASLQIPQFSLSSDSL